MALKRSTEVGKPILLPLSLDTFEHAHMNEPRLGDDVFSTLDEGRCVSRRPGRRPYAQVVYEYAPGTWVMRDWAPCGQEILWQVTKEIGG